MSLHEQAAPPRTVGAVASLLPELERSPSERFDLGPFKCECVSSPPFLGALLGWFSRDARHAVARSSGSLGLTTPR